MKRINALLCRKATMKDFDNLCRLRSQLAFDPEDNLTTEYAAYQPENDSAWIKRCLKSRNKIILIATDKKKIYAHAIIAITTLSKKMKPYYTYHQKALLVHLYVDINHRHQGIGQALLKYTIQYLKEYGVDFIDLECYLYNEKAKNLYNKTGFHDVFVTKRLSFKEPGI